MRTSEVAVLEGGTVKELLELVRYAIKFILFRVANNKLGGVK